MTPEDYDLTHNPAYYVQMEEFDLLDEKEIPELVERMHQGDEEAYATLILSNLRLVAFVARRFADSAKHMDFDDLVEEGNFGLMDAIQKFNPEEGKFSVYAYRGIRMAIKRAIQNQDRTIRLPVHVSEKLAIASKAEDRLQAELGRKPKADELAAYMGIDSEDVYELWRASSMPGSLDSTKQNGEGETVPPPGKLVADDRTQPHEALVGFDHRYLVAQAIVDALDGLEEHERLIIEARYGLNGEEKTLEQIRKQLRMGTKRVNRLQAEAAARLAPVLRESFQALDISVDQTVAIIDA